MTVKPRTKRAVFAVAIPKAYRYPTCTHRSDCRATWSECGDTAQILSAEEKSGGSDKKSSLLGRLAKQSQEEIEKFFGNDEVFMA